MNILFNRARTLVDGVERVRQTLRDEHFPYEEGMRVYEALHESLRLIGTQGETFLKWAGMFPGQELHPGQRTHLRMLELMLQTIERTLG